MAFDEVVGDRIAAEIGRLRGTEESLTVPVSDAFFQATADGDELLVELATQNLRRRLLPSSDVSLLQLGFNPPVGSVENWWISIKGDRDSEVRNAAIAVIVALTNVYGIDPDDIYAATLMTIAERSPSAPTKDRSTRPDAPTSSTLGASPSVPPNKTADLSRCACHGCTR